MMRYRTQGTGDRGETGETGYTWDTGDTGEKGDTGLRFSIHMDNFLWNLTKMHASEKFIDANIYKDSVRICGSYHLVFQIAHWNQMQIRNFFT